MIRRDRGTQNEEPDNGLRVTDRRRIYLDPDGAEQVNEEAEQPNLKPSYVEELEARTKAAEQQVQEVQARFDQLRQQLQRETDPSVSQADCGERIDCQTRTVMRFRRPCRDSVVAGSPAIACT